MIDRDSDTPLYIDDPGDSFRRFRNRCLLAMGICLSALAYSIYDIIQHPRPIFTSQKIQKNTFDRFLEDCIIHPSPEELKLWEELYMRANEEFLAHNPPLSSEMLEQFSLSYARVLRAQVAVYEERIAVKDFLASANILLSPRVRFIVNKYPYRPPVKLRHVWMPDDIVDIQGPGTYIAFGEKRG